MATPNSTPNQTPKGAALSNQSRVYEAFGDDEKLSISQLHERLWDSTDPNNRMSERTIRRSIDSLIERGFLKGYGKDGNAALYGKLEAAFGSGTANLVNFNGELKTVEEFLRLVVEPNATPLQRGRMQILTEVANHAIRRRIAWTVVTSGNPGMNEQLKQVHQDLSGFIRELEFTLSVLQNFADSPIWYPQYRDKVGAELREVQRVDPQLYQLAIDYSRGE